MLAPVGGVWYVDHQAFVRVCQQYGVPVVTRTAQVDGFFLDDGTANSFGMRYLQSEGFQWMEARSIYRRDAFVRYTRAAMINFNGGRLMWLLGIYGSDSFPSVASDDHSWRQAYDLVRNTLNPAASANVGKAR